MPTSGPTPSSSHAFSPIAIVGASVLFPGSRGNQAFWHNILEGKDFIEDIPADHWLIEDYFDPDPSEPDKIYARRGAFLPHVPFDPMKYGLPPTALSSTDTAQLLALIVAEKVIDDAVSLQFEKVDRARVSTILGVASATELVGQMAARIQKPHWVKALRESGLPEQQVQDVCKRIADTYPTWTESTFPGLLGNVVAGRIANRMNLGGANCVVDAACASSLAALQMGVHELQLGHSDLVISGGVDALNDTFMYMCFSKTPALSKTGDCRPFSAGADGTLLGEGIGMVALRRLEDAERDGDKIYAVIRGVGASSDGRAKSIYAPRAEGQSQAIRRAYEQAGYGPEKVELVEAHGTATTAGDAAEFEGLRQVFGPALDGRTQQVALGSIKSQIGHTKSAAGIASLFKVAMALHHRVLPPTIKVDRPNPNLDIENSPLYLNTAARPWVHSPTSTRKGSVSSFGFGGSNFHVALEAYPRGQEQNKRYYQAPAELLLLSGASVDDLRRGLSHLLDQAGRLPLNTVARQAQAAFDATLEKRLALLVHNLDDVERLRDVVLGHLETDPDAPLRFPNQLFYRSGPPETGVAFLFAGQGSQYLNMGADLAMTFPDALAAWEDTADLDFEPGLPLHRVIFPPPVFSAEEKEAQTHQLNQTQWVQPAIGAVSLSQLRLLDLLGVAPTCTGGHSYGELTALYAAGVIPTAEALLRLSRKRGELMAAASEVSGGMTAVITTADTLHKKLDAWEIPVTMANINSPKQVVVAGTLDDLLALETRLQEEGINFRRLPVSTGFHSPLVEASADPFLKALVDLPFHAPSIPVYSNTTARPYPDDKKSIREHLAHQIFHPVHFQRQIEEMYESGARIFLEIGPGSVLTALVGACLEGREHLAVSMDQKNGHGVTAFWNAVGHLAVAGLPLNYSDIWKDFALHEPMEDPADFSPVTVEINGANYGKPYPPKEGAVGRPAPNPEPASQPVAAPAAPSLSAVPLSPSPASFAAETPLPMPTLPHPAPRPVPSPAPQTAFPDASWLQAMHTIQHHLLEAQKSYQQTLTESHLAFLQTTETAFQQLGGVVPAQQPHKPAATYLTHGPAAPAPPPFLPTPDYQPSQPPNNGAAAPAPPPVPTARPSESPFGDGMDAAATEPVGPAFSAEAFEKDLLDVVAAKTGYPASMLNLDMNLEAELGIDSIKRVEILSALQQRYPILQNQDTARLTALQTLGQILDFAARETAVTARTPESPFGDGMDAAVTEPVEPAFSAEAFEKDLLDVVAAKTGYPASMLNLDMNLEAELGIDSIKRVEILSALQQRYPILQNQDTARLTALQTLGQILDFAARETAGVETTPFLPLEAPQEADVAAGVEGRVLRTASAPATGIGMGGLHAPGPIYLVPDTHGIAPLLAALLGEAGLPAEVRADVPDTARKVVFLEGLNDVDGPEGRAQALAVNRRAFETARRLGAHLRQSDGLFVTVQDTGGTFGLEASKEHHAWSSGLAGLAKTAALEWPEASVKALDLQRDGRPPATLAQALFDELVSGGPEQEVGLRADGTRLRLALQTPTNPPAEAPFSDGDVVVASGGARGVTAACLQALARATPLRIALLGRTERTPEPDFLHPLETDAELKAGVLRKAQENGEQLSPIELSKQVGRILAAREVSATLEALTALGAEARYLSVDITDAKAVHEALAGIRQDWGPINAVIHAAGVLADKQIHEKTDAQFDRVFRTKVEGLANLLDATRDDPIHHLCCFSSVAARMGNVGQCDYAMANEVLNKVCQAESRRRGEACRVVSLNWGPWDGGMVHPGLKAHFAAMGVALIDLDAGADFFVDTLTRPTAPDVESVIGGSLAGKDSEGNRTSTGHRWQWRIDTAQYPLLDSHQIHGKRVVPMMLVNEWMCRLALALYPDKHLQAVRHMTVFKGIVLDDPGVAEWFTFTDTVTARDALIEVEIRLTDATGRPRYRAIIDLGDAPPTTPSAPKPLQDLAPWQWNAAEVYHPDTIFHGPDFHVIRRLIGQSPEGGAGELRTTEALAAPSVSRHTDIGVLDGSLQLALLWSKTYWDTPSLPTGFDTLQVYQPGPWPGPVRCEMIRTEGNALMSRGNATFTDEHGALLAVIIGQEMHAVPAASLAHASSETES